MDQQHYTNRHTYTKFAHMVGKEEDFGRETYVDTTTSYDAAHSYEKFWLHCFKAAVLLKPQIHVTKCN